MNVQKNDSLDSRLVVKSQVRWLKIDKIQFDHSYQRDVKAGSRRIANDLMEEALGVPMVGQREDFSLWCVDGQQRITALTKLDKAEVLCQVFASRGPEHEAEVYKRVNMNRTKLNAWELYKARIVANDPDAIVVRDAVESVGYRLTESKSGRGKTNPDSAEATKAKQVTAISTIFAMYEKFKSVEPIKFALVVAGRAWPDDPNGVVYHMIAGLAQYHQMYQGVVDVEYVVPRLGRHTAHKILYAARLASTGNNYATAVTEQIDKAIKRRMMKK